VKYGTAADRRGGDTTMAGTFFTGRWARQVCDHRDGLGGGILDLIQQVRGGSRGEALRWLADMRGFTLDDFQSSPRGQAPTGP